MVVPNLLRSRKDERRTHNPHALMAVKTIRPKLFRRSSVTSWGKDNLRMTRAAADINLKEIMLSVQQQKYEDRDKARQREITHARKYEDEEWIHWRDERRTKLLSRFHARRDFLASWEGEGQGNWRANQNALWKYEGHLLSYELATRFRSTARDRIRRVQCADDVARGTRWFEKNLDRLGLDPGNDPGASTGGGRDNVLVPDNQTQASFHAKLSRAVLDQNFQSSSNAEAMAELRSRGKIGRRARKEREHRRLKTEIDQRNAKAESDALRDVSERQEAMLEAGRARRASAASYREDDRTRIAESAAEAESLARRKDAETRAFEIAFAHRSADARERYLEAAEERRAATDALQSRARSRGDGKRQAAAAVCEEVALEIVDLAVVTSKARVRNKGFPLAPTTWARLVGQFCSSEPFVSGTVRHEPPVPPRDTAREANARIQRRNLTRCQGNWRPLEDYPPNASLPGIPTSVLDEALSVARKLVRAQHQNDAREHPSAYSCYDRDDGEDDPGRGISLKIVLFATSPGLGPVCSELSRWTGLYCCSLQEALDCAAEVGASMADEDKKSVGKEKEEETSDASAVATLTTDDAKDDGESGIPASESEKGGEMDKRDALSRRAFHPEAREENVRKFKEAAAAYHALLAKNSKSATTPTVTLATKTDILVKHLACRSPQGQGWILVDYPRCLLEAKMLENALTGFTDADVAAELGAEAKGSKPDAKRRKENLTAGIEGESTISFRSGLDTVLRIPAVHLRESLGEQESSWQRMLSSEGGDTIHVSRGSASAGEGSEAAEMSGAECPPAAGSATDAETETLQQGNNQSELMEWWSSFDSGHLPCDVPREATIERLLETIFLLVIAADHRKTAHGKRIEHADPEPEEVIDAGASVGGPDSETTNSMAIGAVDSARSLEPPLPSPRVPTPPEMPLISRLEELRARRRERMPRATRLHIETICGERELELSRIRAVLARAEGKARSERYHEREEPTPGTPTDTLSRLEAECTASSVTDWLAAAEYSFTCSLRKPDGRWEVTCARLEHEIASAFARWDPDSSPGRELRSGSHRSKRHSCGRGRGNGMPSSLAGSNDARDALGDFEFEAGNVADDRHAVADVAYRSIRAEAEQRIKTWARVAAGAAADLCAAERYEYLAATRDLRALGSLFGLKEVLPSELDGVRTALRRVSERLVSEISGVMIGRNLDRGGEKLEREINRALQHGLLDADVPVSREAGDHNDLVPATELSLSDRLSIDELEEVRSANTMPWENSEFDDPRGEFGSSDHDGWEAHGILRPDPGTVASEEDNRALMAGLGQCRHAYLCRARGVVGRLARALRRCEFLTSTSLGRLRRLKRRRVRLEHECVARVVSAAKGALSSYDIEGLGSMLHQGIGILAEDHGTSAADPYVALSWGANVLGERSIKALAAALRRPAAAALRDDGAGVHRSELARRVRAWAEGVPPAVNAHGAGVDGGLPCSWTSMSNGYIDDVCDAVARGSPPNNVPWRRLIHCLLLGHLESIPTLEELGAMLGEFRREASSPCEVVTGADRRATSAEPGLPSSPSWSAEGIGLRVPAENMRRIRLWFQQECETSLNTAGSEEVGDDDERTMGLTKPSRIKALYLETWEEDEGLLDAMDLLLTLCALPGDSCETAPTAESSDDQADGGIPFSLGLFRAFSLLSDETCLQRLQGSPHGSRGRPVDSAAIGRDSSYFSGGAGFELSDLGEGQDAAPLSATRGPCVTFQQLGAILRHAGMAAADIREVFEAAYEMDETVRTEHRLREDSSGNVGGGEMVSCLEGRVGVMGGRSGVVGDDGSRRGDRFSGVVEEERGSTPDESEEGSSPNNAEVVVGEAEDSTAELVDGNHERQEEGGGTAAEGDGAPDDAGGATNGGTTRRSASDGVSEAVEPSDVAAAVAVAEENNQPIITLEDIRRVVSFDAVMDCLPVRKLVRLGAYTLPSSRLTSGQSHAESSPTSPGDQFESRNIA